MATGLPPSQSSSSLRSSVVDEARAWLGTPYVWRAAVRGQGVDCAKLVWTVLNRFYYMPVMPEQYHEGDVMSESYTRVIDLMLAVAAETRSPEPGDIVLFKFARSWVHCGIVSKSGHMIHAYGRRGAGCVVEQPFGVMQGRSAKFFEMRPEMVR